MHLCLGGAARLHDEAVALLPPPRYLGQYQEDYTLPGLLMCGELHKALHQAAKESRTSGSNFVEAGHLLEASHLVDSLMSSLTACEKILRTPLPWSYSRHTSRFLTLWMGTLPFALVGTLSKRMTVIVVAAASYCMFGIEEISHLLEQPFLGDRLEGDQTLWTEAADQGFSLRQRGSATQPYDIGIPVCRLACQTRSEVLYIASEGAAGGGFASI